MSHRSNWSLSSNKSIFNFKWKYSQKGVDYAKFKYEKKLTNDKIKLINIFYKHEEISNKKFLFLNLLKYCNQIGINIFNYIPFTIIAAYGNKDHFESLLNGFKEIFEFINSEICLKNLQSNKEMIHTNKKYSDLFKVNKK